MKKYLPPLIVGLAAVTVGVAVVGEQLKRQVDKGTASGVPIEEAQSKPSARKPQAGITSDQDSRIPPGPPGKVEASVKKGDVTVTWHGTRLDIIVAYRVYRKCDGRDQWQRIRQVKVKNDNTGKYEVVDGAFIGRCEYAVSAIDHYDNEGPKSEAVRPKP